MDQPARSVAYGSLNSECRCLKLVDTFRNEGDKLCKVYYIMELDATRLSSPEKRPLSDSEKR